jgi:hypothetical protein
LGFKIYEFWKLELFSENGKAFSVNWDVFFMLLGRRWVARCSLISHRGPYCFDHFFTKIENRSERLSQWRLPTNWRQNGGYRAWLGGRSWGKRSWMWWGPISSRKGGGCYGALASLRRGRRDMRLAGGRQNGAMTESECLSWGEACLWCLDLKMAQGCGGVKWCG